MVRIDAADAADALQRVLVAHLAAQGIAGVGGIDDDAAVLQYLHRLTDEANLGIVRMYVKMLTHMLFSR
ncbi:hypothetical protein D3C84_1213610 [compost metagenome]